jgi:hypothetical protein
MLSIAIAIVLADIYLIQSSNCKISQSAAVHQSTKQYSVNTSVFVRNALFCLTLNRSGSSSGFIQCVRKVAVHVIKGVGSQLKEP